MNQPRYHEIGVCGMCRRTFRADRLAGGLCPECRERNRPPAPRPRTKWEQWDNGKGTVAFVCRGCGKTFHAASRKTRFCPECAKTRILASNRESWRRWNTRRKRPDGQLDN